MDRREVRDNDGILRCSVCGGALEKKIQYPMLNGSGLMYPVTVRCMCRCQEAEKIERDQRIQFEEEQRYVDGLKRMSLMDERLKNVCFSNYVVNQENRKAFQIASRYVERFDEMYRNHQGIMFCGGVGTGKSYTAAAIANELLAKRVSVIMTSFIKLMKDLGRLDEDDDLIKRLNQAKLLIIDDLGAERGTDYALEKVYDIIDSRYRSGKPIILTTNLEMSQMKKCEDIRYARIYDRIFEMCYPVIVTGVSWRKREAAARYANTKMLLEGGA